MSRKSTTKSLIALTVALLALIIAFEVGRLTTSLTTTLTQPKSQGATQALTPNSTITSTTGADSSMSQKILAAKEVESCESAHGMNSQFETISTASNGPSTFEGCIWPPSIASQQDGYWRIDLTHQLGPGRNEASSSDVTNVLTPTCQKVRVVISVGVQGTQSTLPAVVLPIGIITSIESLGQQWTGTRPYPYVTSNEIAVLSNSSYEISAATCVG